MSTQRLARLRGSQKTFLWLNLPLSVEEEEEQPGSPTTGKPQESAKRIPLQRPSHSIHTTRRMPDLVRQAVLATIVERLAERPEADCIIPRFR